MRTTPFQKCRCLAVVLCLLVVKTARAQEPPVEDLSSVGDGLVLSETERDSSTLDFEHTDAYFVGAGPEIGLATAMYSLFTQLGNEGTTECKFGTAEQSGQYLTQRLLFFRCGETTARITIHRSPSGADVYTTEIVTEPQPRGLGQ